MRREMPPNPWVVQNKSLCFASPPYSSSSLGHAGEVLLQAGQKHKTQMLRLTTIWVKENEISLVETEFRAVHLHRDGLSQQGTSFWIFAYLRRSARGRSSVWCSTDWACVLPLICLFMFKFRSVPALLHELLQQARKKGLKGMGAEGCAMGCPANLQPQHWSCWGLTTFSSQGQ